jgi:mono/diheme cytochrome c family protein
MRTIVAVALALLLPAGVSAQTAERKAPVVKKVGAANIQPSDGQQMFNSYCAACHGTAGRGDGPAAAALTPIPSDLTVFAKKRGGAFSAKDFDDKVTGLGMSQAHGSTDMPVWGPILRQLGNNELRVFNLRNYVASLQVR